MNREILVLADALAREKSVPKELIFQALEQALASATKRLHKERIEARVEIDRESGDYKSFRRWHIVPEEEFEDPDNQMMLREAHEFDTTKQMGEYLEEPLEPIPFGRIGAQAAKQVILQKVRDAEREQVLEEFLERNDKLINGTVRRIDRGAIIVESGRVEGVIPRDQLIARENFRVGDRIRAYVLRIDRQARGPQLILSRTAPQFVSALFELEVPEIEEGVIEVKAVARDPGLRAKIAVKSNDPRLDPQGTCIGMRGSRVNAVTNELAGERIDIILWSEETAQFVINALAPAQITSIVVDEEHHSMDVVVNEDNLALAIGKGGQNVRLATELTGWQLNLMSEEQSANKSEAEAARTRSAFMVKLDVDEEVAQILVDEGFSTVEEVAYVPLAELQAVEAFDDDTINELRTRARNAALTDEIAKEEVLENASDDLKTLEGVDTELLMKLSKFGITTRDALGDLAADELCAIRVFDEARARELIDGDFAEITDDEKQLMGRADTKAATQLIARARESWFAKSE
ncbi:MAG: transcription termination factor NusA [Casimicrobium sp.]